MSQPNFSPIKISTDLFFLVRKLILVFLGYGFFCDRNDCLGYYEMKLLPAHALHKTDVYRSLEILLDLFFSYTVFDFNFSS